MEFGVLGPLTVRDVGARLDIGTPKSRVLLAVLLCRAGGPVTDDVLADALWGRERPKSASSNVRTYVHYLRRQFGDPGRIVREGRGYFVRMSRDELDATRFDDLASAGRSAEAAGELDRAGELFHEALGLWLGDAYCDIVDVPVVDVEADRLAELRLSVLERRIDVDLRLDRHGELIGELTALSRENPLRERIWAQLMLALCRSGRRADALAAYSQARDTFVEETGLDPSRELRDLHRAILNDADSLDARAPQRAVRPGSPAVPRMLPRAIGDFTGHEAELAEMAATLGGDRTPGGPPVVAVSGRGGIGKTTLAVHAAHRLRKEYPGGQLFAVLAGTRPESASQHEVLGRFLRALGVPDGAVPENEDERATTYRSLLADRRVLVVIDDAGDERQIEKLLPGSGTCGVIVTSRVRLAGLAGAHRIDLAEMSDAEGGALLRKIVGGRPAVADPAETEELLRLCAGLPLALRIAGSLLAARPHWAPADLIARLADARYRLDGLRHRDLEIRASFAPSYRRLQPATQRLFRLLGMLDARDFGPRTAAALLDATPRAAQDLLDELVDVRLLDVTTARGPCVRYRFNDLIRIYARERAEAEEPAGVRRAALVRAFGGLPALTEIVRRPGDRTQWPPTSRDMGVLSREKACTAL